MKSGRLAALECNRLLRTHHFDCEWAWLQNFRVLTHVFFIKNPFHKILHPPLGFVKSTIIFEKLDDGTVRPRLNSHYRVSVGELTLIFKL